MKFNIDKIVEEWSYRVDNGIPDVKNPLHIVQLRSMLYEYKYSREFIENLLDKLQLIGEGSENQKQRLNRAEQIIVAEAKGTKLDKFIDTHIKKDKDSTYKKDLDDYISRIPSGAAVIAARKFISKNPTNFFKNLGKYTKIEDISNSDYKSGFAKTVFDTEPKGIGRGELYIAWVVKDAKISGGGETFDVKINGKKYEVKDYSKGAKDTVRLGVHGKVTQFSFWREIQKTIAIVSGIDRKSLTDILGEASSELFKALDDIDLGKIQSGEVSQKNLKALRNFYVVANSFVEETGDGYNQMVLKGPNLKPKDYMIKMISDSEVPSSGKASIEIVDDKRGKTIIKFMNDLRRLNYVRTPDDLWRDIHSAVKSINTKYKSVTFIIFRPGPKMMIQGKDFSALKFGSITAGAIKVLEDNITAGWESIEGATSGL